MEIFSALEPFEIKILRAPNPDPGEDIEALDKLIERCDILLEKCKENERVMALIKKDLFFIEMRYRTDTISCRELNKD